MDEKFMSTTSTQKNQVLQGSVIDENNMNPTDNSEKSALELDKIMPLDNVLKQQLENKLGEIDESMKSGSFTLIRPWDGYYWLRAIKNEVKQGRYSLDEQLRERLWQGVAVAKRLADILCQSYTGKDSDPVCEIAVSELGMIVVEPMDESQCQNFKTVDGITMDFSEYETYAELVNRGEIDPNAPLWEQLDDIFSPWLDMEMWGKWIEYEDDDGQVVRSFKNTNYGAPHHYAPLWNLYFTRVEAQQE